MGQRTITYTQTKGVKCRSWQVHVGSLLQLKMWYEQLIAALPSNFCAILNAVLGRGVPISKVEYVMLESFQLLGYH